MAYPQQAPAFDPSMQGAPGAPQNPLAPQLMGIQAQQPIPVPQPQQPGQGQYVNPALAASILALNNQQSQQSGVDRSRKLADSMRADAKDQLQGQQVGRVYKSAGLANLAASLAASYGAMKMGQGADATTSAMNDQRTAAMQKYFDALTGPSQVTGGAGQ